jgi:hypothetical protein
MCGFVFMALDEEDALKSMFGFNTTTPVHASLACSQVPLEFLSRIVQRAVCIETNKCLIHALRCQWSANTFRRLIQKLGKKCTSCLRALRPAAMRTSINKILIVASLKRSKWIVCVYLTWISLRQLHS